MKDKLNCYMNEFDYRYFQPLIYKHLIYISAKTKYIRLTNLTDNSLWLMYRNQVIGPVFSNQYVIYDLDYKEYFLNSSMNGWLKGASTNLNMHMGNILIERYEQ